MSTYGYVRVSTKEQNEDRQMIAMGEFGVEKGNIILDKRINKNVLGRTQAEVKEKLKAAMAESQVLDVSREDEYTVATWLKAWYDLYVKPNVRLATADRYHLMIETYTIPRIGKIKLKKLTSRDHCRQLKGFR